VAIVPVVILLASWFGKSAATMARNVGAPAEPSGAAKNVFAVCDASVKVSVPLAVTGDPETVKMDGAESATDVTVPDVNATQVESPRSIVVAFAVPEPNRAVAIVPLVSFDVSWFGISAATIARNTGAPAIPSGAAKNVFAVWEFNENVSVPDTVTGDPDAVKIDGTERATDVTVPDPDVIVCHVPSPRRNVEEFAVPLPKRAAEIVPVVILAASNAGISAATRVRIIGAPDTPSGPAKNVFAACVASVAVIVPAVVTGEPATENSDAGKESATDVTATVALLRAALNSPASNPESMPI